VKKEKGFFGIYELQEHINKWTVVAFFSILVLIMIPSINKMLEQYDEKNCGHTSCVETMKEQENMIKMEIGKKVRTTDQVFKTNGMEYRLYLLDGKKEEFILAGWNKYKKGLGLGDIVQGVEEKEIIGLAEKGKYVFVWSSPETKIVIKNDGKEIGIQEKKKEETKIEIIEIEKKGTITFE
jgi:competence protein ComGC